MWFDLSQTQERKRLLWTLAVIYTLAIIYGSLIPFEFHNFSFGKIFIHLSQTENYHFIIGSRSDLMANFLLYIPLGFFWMGAWYSTRLEASKWHHVLLMWFPMIMLSGTIEVLQIFSSIRSFDIRDIVTNAMGSLVGIGIWCVRGNIWLQRISSLRLHSGLNGVAGTVLTLYLGVFTLYQLMPLDLSLSPAEIFDTLNEGRLVVIPFAGEKKSWLMKIHSFSIELIIWTIIGMLWLFSSPQPAIRIWGRAILFAVVVEFMQLFVLSRVTDITDVLSALIGSGIGIRLGIGIMRRFPAIVEANKVRRRRAWVLLGLGAFVVWYMVVLWYYWFPFNFQFSLQYMSERAAEVPPLPFWSHFQTKEFHALADMLETAIFFAPLGSILGFVAARIDIQRYRAYAVEFSVLLLLAAATFVEFGQLLLPNRYPDLTDIVFGLAASLLGYWLIYTLQMRYQMQQEEVAENSQNTN